MIPYHEIVQVLNSNTLIDRESHPSGYTTLQHEGLRVGYYIIIWPASVIQREYNADARYIGPFPTHRDAAGSLQGAVRARYLADSNEPCPLMARHAKPNLSGADVR